MSDDEPQDWSKVCRRCREGGIRPPHYGSDRRCAFATGAFRDDNWNCLTIHAIREMAEAKGRHQWSGDQNCATVPCNPENSDCMEFIVLGWYKRRGRIEFAGVLCETRMNPLTLEIAEKILDGTYSDEGDDLRGECRGEVEA